MKDSTCQMATVVVLAVSLTACRGAATAPGALAGPAPPASPPSPTRIHLFGTVLDTIQRPLADVRIEVLDGVETGKWTLSDASGRFELSGAFARTETLRATKDGYVPVTHPFASNLFFHLPTVAPPIDLSGEYTLTITADDACGQLREPYRSRTYFAGIDQVFGTLKNATFLSGWDFFWVYSAGDAVSIAFDHDGLPPVVEHVDASGFLAFVGSATFSVEAAAPSVSAPFAGLIEYCVPEVEMTSHYDCSRARVRHSCSSPKHRLVLTRR